MASSCVGSRRKSVSGGGNGPSTEQRQLRAVYEALNSRDFAALHTLAFAKHGFVSSEVRRVIWFFLLGISSPRATNGNWRQLLAEIVEEGKDSRVMKADVERSVYSWDVHTCIRMKSRNQKRVHLSEIMHAVLQRHKGKLGYFQGFHDIALVFMEVGTTTQAFYMVERLALFHLTDQLCWPFDQGLTRLLSVLFHLIETIEPAVAEALSEADCSQCHFAVPWVLTWFSHTLPRLEQVMRLFDCLLSSHPAVVLYFVASLLLEYKDEILRTPRELPEMVCLMQQVKWGQLDVDDWAARTRLLAEKLPPQELMMNLPTNCRLELPVTSPLFHYPHPWMTGPLPEDTLAVSRLSPIYGAEGEAALKGCQKLMAKTSGRGPQHSLPGKTSAMMSLFFRVAGVSGVAVVACAFAVSNLGLLKRF
eukprot:TRINITY_DN54647_c0_g1_i1.p1 TRINITY_DN54647_c0_g1~~TRINITY_DN54647_c0_g1_i1.p1  ORF type:complete len:419 (+),score=62.49 TRINITY_DN54647_c0_g1_i1:170-1426(+)